ncbi:hypothetical protein BRADI_4g16603v3 [Brachypodium distachyon]|uniref:Uncharacterized protein n=1 Tax=Brachypodium distachyon TaxID=15368 RepID=A0A0Q3L6K6_BRADI|nr:hypothetical protein BRADI_4g16603v3 [Brachypodium distachyon]
MLTKFIKIVAEHKFVWYKLQKLIVRFSVKKENRYILDSMLEDVYVAQIVVTPIFFIEMTKFRGPPNTLKIQKFHRHFIKNLNPLLGLS